MNTYLIALLTGLLLTLLCLFIVQPAAAQTGLNPALQDASLNNLALPAGYKTGKPGELGAVKKTGHGKQALILIPGGVSAPRSTTTSSGKIRINIRSTP
jgi:hypothetical protein